MDPVNWHLLLDIWIFIGFCTYSRTGREWAVSLLMTLASANGEGGIVRPHVELNCMHTVLLRVTSFELKLFVTQYEMLPVFHKNLVHFEHVGKFSQCGGACIVCSAVL